ncbi:glutathione-disulfide reductase [Rubrivivax albus]|uniref:Glutathione-disulfide reductase n=1 Tax=Rubrivivax albus TaxID=2499835 RepID=A0A3S2TKD5_9BURK|nr:glutathione-disulfide reductase [Rubrivivax albus]RVT49630.1 glutathione-disulfide reductase [Rubrivivax albus]
MGHEFDLIVVGAGSGGVAAARRAAAHGARVVIVEAGRVGGTCVIRGCVPKKLMMYAAAHGRGIAEARAYGWTVDLPRFDMGHWARAKAAETERLETLYGRMLAEAGVTLVRGHAELQSEAAVRVGAKVLQAPRILVATGGAPSRDAIPGLAEAMTSNDVLDLSALPSDLLVIGGGYIAVEFASILQGLGCPVTLAFRDALPLRGFDTGLRERLALALQQRGITLAGGVALASLTRDADGFRLLRSDGTVLRAGAALNATGRHPATDGLGLAAAGVRTDERGAIAVDADSRTSTPGIWAVGDVTQRMNLTPVAIAEGRAFADTEFGARPTRVDHRTIASAVFTDPSLATVGLTEEAARQRGPVDVYEADFRPMKTAFAGSEERTYMKLVVDGLDDRVLGVHMLGADAPEIVQSLAVAMVAGATKRDFDRTMAIHPTAAEEFVLMRSPVRRWPMHDRMPA